jgi:hypothetical protein
MKTAKYKGILVRVAVAASVTLFGGCGGSSSPPPSPPPQTPPTLSSLSPIVTMANGGVTLTANGSGFTSTSEIMFNGSAKATTLSGGQLTAQLSASDVAQPGTYPVSVQSGSLSSGSLDFYVVPAINPSPISVTAGNTVDVAAIAVQQPKSFGSKPLSWVAVGTGNSAGVTAISVKQGASATLFTVGQGFQAGIFFAVSGSSSDVSVTQPLVSDFSQTTDGIPSANLTLNVSSSAAPGVRNLLVTNPGGEVSVFPGGLIVTQGP